MTKQEEFKQRIIGFVVADIGIPITLLMLTNWIGGKEKLIRNYGLSLIVVMLLLNWLESRRDIGN